LAANFSSNPDESAIIGKLIEKRKEDIYAYPNMPSLSSIRYNMCRNGEDIAIAHKKIK